MKNLKTILENFMNKNYTLMFFGSCIIFILLWNRFIRERLPREIPFILTYKSFFCLTILCIGLFVTFVSFFYKANTPFKSIRLIKEYIYTSLHVSFNFYINKLRSLVKVNVINLYIINFLKKYLSKKFYIYLFFISPKIILPIILLLDIFYFGKIENFYKVMFFMFLPLLYNFIYFSLHYFYIEQLESIERVLNIKIVLLNEDNLVFSIPKFYGSHYYIQEHTLDRLKIRKNVTEFHVELNPNFIEKKLKEKTKSQQEYFYDLYCKNAFISSSKIFEVLYFYTLQEKQVASFINLFMVFTYFCCWFYLLVNANYSNTDIIIAFLINFQDKENPFY